MSVILFNAELDMGTWNANLETSGPEIIEYTVKLTRPMDTLNSYIVSPYGHQKFLLKWSRRIENYQENFLENRMKRQVILKCYRNDTAYRESVQEVRIWFKNSTEREKKKQTQEHYSVNYNTMKFSR